MKIEELFVGPSNTLGVGEFEVETAMKLNEVIEALNAQEPKALEEKECPCKCPDELTHLQKQIDLLADFLLKNYQDEFGKVPAGESATEMAVRLLSKPQEEPKKCCNDCYEKGACIRVDCPCRKKETEPKEDHYFNIGRLAGVPLFTYGNEEMAQAAADKLKELLIKSQG